MMNNRTARIACRALPLALFLLLAGGCATRKEIVGFQEDTRTMRGDIEAVKKQQELILEALSSMDSNLSEMRARTEFGSTETDERMRQIAAQLDDILTRMDRSLAPLEELVRKEAEKDTTERTGIGVDIFDAAMQDLSQGNYDLAEVGFVQFLEENPASGLADAARYGLGESYYARARYEDAAAEYSRVVESGRQVKKTPAALLKLGLCYKALNRLPDARKSWQRLLDEYPGTEEASVAKQRLEELRNH